MKKKIQKKAFNPPNRSPIIYEHDDIGKVAQANIIATIVDGEKRCTNMIILANLQKIKRIV